MNRTIKKVFAFFLSAVLLFSLAAPSAFAENESYLSNFTNTLGIAKDLLAEGLNDITLSFEEPGDDNVSRLMGSYVTNAGEKKEVWMGIYYNHDTEVVYGSNERTGILDSGFNYDVGNSVAYSTIDAWQRDFGFTPFFDLIANMTAFNYVTRRLFFDWDGQEFMIQIWKGNYGFNNFVGGEIGIYNRPSGSLGMKYNCVTDDYIMPLSMVISDSSKTYVDRAETTWWLTGFNLTRHHVPCRQLNFEGSITFPNAEMLSAFLGSTHPDDVKLTTDGLTVYIEW